ncbi:Metallo-dependent phosphatase-like protein [Sporodiniella umbellata]|nr:Metallo-dependent phosphatase-like protein [Sporodiniella umbellata]
MGFFRGETESVQYIDAIPQNYRTAQQKKRWRYIALGVAAIVVIIVVVAVAVVVSESKKKQSDEAYGVSPYANMTPIITRNDTELQQKQRIFVVGDVHGCIDEFNRLLDTLAFNATTDQLILAGDLTSKGPDSLGVIRRAKSLGLLCVRGNHDDKLVRFKTFENQRGQNAMHPLNAVMPEGNVPDPLKFKNYHEPLALSMTADDYNYLASCPVILHMPFLNNAVIVHAGLDPAVPALKDQVPYQVMTMRDIDSHNKPTSESGVGIQWAKTWNTYEQSLTVNNTRIYYGHDAGRGLNLQQTTFGLDTGCVYGGKLTAINIKTHELTQVNCATHVAKNDDDD